jgi:hypothetical protein
MKIRHAGACATPEAARGVNATIWQLSWCRRTAGHEATLPLDEPPNDEARDVAAASRIELLDGPRPIFCSMESKTGAPDLVWIAREFPRTFRFTGQYLAPKR